MARPKKHPTFSCMLTNGESLFGDYISTTELHGGIVGHLVRVDDLDFVIPVASCVWWAVGKKAYRDVLIARREEIKRHATELFQTYMQQHKDRLRQEVESEGRTADPSVPGGTPVQNFEESNQVGDNESAEVRNAHERLTLGHVSIRGIAEMQNDPAIVRRDIDRELQRNPPSRARRSSVQRIPEDTED